MKSFELVFILIFAHKPIWLISAWVNHSGIGSFVWAWVSHEIIFGAAIWVGFVICLMKYCRLILCYCALKASQLLVYQVWYVNF